MTNSQVEYKLIEPRARQAGSKSPMTVISLPGEPEPPRPAHILKVPGTVWMTFASEVATIPVAVVTVSLISVYAIVRVVFGIDDSTSLLQGYAIGVIPLVAHMGIAVSVKK